MPMELQFINFHVVVVIFDMKVWCLSWVCCISNLTAAEATVAIAQNALSLSFESFSVISTTFGFTAVRSIISPFLFTSNIFTLLTFPLAVRVAINLTKCDSI